MTAININIEDFLKILVSLKQKGAKLINLDMIPDESNPKMNKLIIRPVGKGMKKAPPPPEEDPEIHDPDVRLDSDDIFNLFNGIV